MRDPLRISWEAMRGLVGRIVAAHIDRARLESLYHLGVDEISYRTPHRFS